MSDELSVVLASNRGPVSFVREGSGTLQTRRGAGGLAGALDSIARRLRERAVWVAAAASPADRAALADGTADALHEQLGYRVRLLDIDANTYSRYYDTVANRMLWFANHCLWDEVGPIHFGPEDSAAWRDAYRSVNERFARAAAEAARADSFVLFQDYHLATAPRFLKQLAPDATVLHFTHSSFCGPAGVDALPPPIPREVVEGLLGSDLLGFHVPRWADGFLDCCEAAGHAVDRERRLIDHDARTTWVRAYPIPIDAEQLRARASQERARAWAESLAADRRPIIARADRIEPSKNIVRGFLAFGRLLDRRSELRGTVRFVASLYPSRQSMAEYVAYAERIRGVVADVNARHPDAIELYVDDDFDRTLGLLSVYDVLLVNPLMDGMNLVSKEGPVINQNEGVLVLSKDAGSFYELGDDAIAIEDQRDLDATADALERALDLPRDRRRRQADALRRRAGALRPEHWIEAQLEDLARVQRGGEPTGLRPSQVETNR